MTLSGEVSNRLLCCICEENLESLHSLHYHQINFHTQEELSFALLSLKGNDKEELKNVCPHFVFSKSGGDDNNSTSHNIENSESEMMVKCLRVCDTEHSDSLITINSSITSNSDNSVPFITDNYLKENHDNNKSENICTLPEGKSLQIVYPDAILSPKNSPCPQSHIKAIISRLPNIVMPEEQQLNDSYVLPSPVSQHHRSSVLYDYGKNSNEFGDYFVPLVKFENGVDVVCGVEREVRSTETQTGVMNIITRQLAAYRKHKQITKSTGYEKIVKNLPEGDRKVDYEKILQELPISTGNGKIGFEMCGKKNYQELAVERKFTCWTCGKDYKKKSHLERHIRIHTGVRPFFCPHCEKKFTLHSVLQQHLRIHTGEKPYSCNMCQQSFSQKSGLLTHMMLHTGKPFKCNYCSKAFVSNSKLLLHLRCRTGPHRHTCKICGMQFYTAGALKQHSQSHY